MYFINLNNIIIAFEASASSGRTPDLYAGDAWFKSQPGHSLS
jgi:hypothetical protein